MSRSHFMNRCRLGFLLLAGLTVLPVVGGCANFIRQSDAVVPDVVPGTDRVSLDSLNVEGAIVQAKVRFLCQRQLYAVTNIYETAYRPEHELYEIPIGVVTLIPSFLWYGLSELLTAGAIMDEASTAALDWSAAGLNPLLNVENGMFVERYRIRRKPGSQRPQEGSRPEPYDAVVPPAGGSIDVAFQGGETITIPVPDDVFIQLNLLEVARVMPTPDAQRLDLTVTLQWNPEAPPIRRSLEIYIDERLARKLYDLRDASRQLFAAADQAGRDAALEAFRSAGFSREAAMARDRLPELPAALER